MDRKKLEEIEKDILTRHNSLLTFADVSAEIGMKNKVAVHAFLEGLPVYMIGRRRKWRAADIAKRILQGETFTN